MMFHRLRNEDEAAAASEYAILVAFVAAAVSLAVSQFTLTDVYQAVVEKVASYVK